MMKNTDSVEVLLISIIDLPEKSKIRNVEIIDGKLIDLKRNICSNISIKPRENFRCEPFNWIKINEKNNNKCLNVKVIDVLKRVISSSFLFIMDMPNEETLRKSKTKIHREETVNYLEKFISKEYSIKSNSDENMLSFFTRKFYETATRLRGRRLMVISLIEYKKGDKSERFIMISFSKIREKGIILQAFEGTIDIKEIENMLDIIVPPTEEEGNVRFSKMIIYPSISKESETKIERGFVKIYDESSSPGTYKFIDAIIPLVEKFGEILTKNMIARSEDQETHSIGLPIAYATILEGILDFMVKNEKNILEPEEFIDIIDKISRETIGNKKFKLSSMGSYEALVSDIKDFITREQIYVARENLNKMLSRNIEIQIGNAIFSMPLRDISFLKDKPKVALYPLRRGSKQYLAVIFVIENANNIDVRNIENQLAFTFSRISITRRKIPWVLNKRISFDIERNDNARKRLRELCCRSGVCDEDCSEFEEHE